MRVGLDLRDIRPVSSGGIRVFLREILNSLVCGWPEAAFHVFQSEGDPPLVGEAPGPATVERISAVEPRDTVDARARAAGLDVLLRGFPVGFHGFPAERQVVVIPDLQHEALPEFFQPEVLRDRRRRFDAVLRHAGAIAVPSEFSRRTIVERPETGCATVVVVSGGPPRAPGLGVEHPQDPGVPYFLFPANLWPHKNHRRLFQAFRRFLDRARCDVELLLTGDPAGWEELSREAAGLPIRHLGYVSESKLAALYRNAMGLVFLTLYEGFGLPVLEAFHYGVPVLGSNRTSTPEIAGGAILPCDPTDVAAMAEALTRFATDRALRDRLVRLGRRRLETYSWERSAQTLRATLEQIAWGRDTTYSHGPAAAGIAPEVSVIITLTDHRGVGVAAVESVTRRQECPRDSYEVIVVTDGGEPALEPRIRGVLSPQDRLARGQTRNGATLADNGAGLARGRILFFTEGHCELARDTVSELIAFFATGDFDAACVSCTGRSQSMFARMEQRVFEEHFRAWCQPGDWRKVLFRGFAILRRVYLDTGGFESQYGLFAERTLAATLHARGYRSGWAERAGVVHTNVTRYRQLRDSIVEYVAGELSYRQSHDPEYCTRYFGEPPEWVERRDWGPEEVRVTLRALSGLLAGPVWLDRASAGGGLSLWREAADLLGAAAFGRAWPAVRGRLGVGWARLRYLAAPGEGEHRYRAYVALWHWTARLAAAHYLSAHAGISTRPPVRAGDVPVAGLDRYRSFGLHTVEQVSSRPFRWTGPLAGVWLALDPGRHRVTLQTEPLRPRGAVWVCWDAQPLQAVERRARDISFEVTMPAEARAPRSLVLAAEPVPRRMLPSGERRRLGLPLFGLRITPLG